MTCGEIPHVECNFNRANRCWQTRWFNCDYGYAPAIERRIEQIEKQLLEGRGLTNREKRELARERNFLQRTFTREETPCSRLDDPRKLKAAEKKLRWLGRKTDAEK
jgi:hypothetical protein